MDKIQKEVEKLAEGGVSEIILVAQDTTQYGKDLGNTSLAQLIRELSKVSGIEWIRILYCYPEGITDELIQEIKINPKVCKYLDIPIQHASDAVLKRMARKSTHAELRSVLTKLRSEIPEIAIRTTLIVGFPGENEEDFETLCDFVKEVQFDRLGVFTYSQEEDTPAASYQGQLDEKIKERRKEVLMDLQHQISKKLTRARIGSLMDVLIEGKLVDDDVYIGRSYLDAPDIDGQVFIEYDGQLISGDFVKVRIVNANDYDLIGEIADEYSK